MVWIKVFLIVMFFRFSLHLLILWLFIVSLCILNANTNYKCLLDNLSIDKIFELIEENKDMLKFSLFFFPLFLYIDKLSKIYGYKLAKMIVFKNLERIRGNTK